MSGRPHTLDEVRQAEVCALVSTGVSLRSAARYIGCDRKTIHREQLRNEQFAANLRQAEMRAEYSPLEAMHDAAHRHWRAAAWLLERTRPQQYARNSVGVVKLTIVRELIEQIQEHLAAELAPLPEGATICRRLQRAVDRSCRELTAVPAAPRPSQRFRPSKNRPSSAAPNEKASAELELICLGDLPPLEPKVAS